MTVIVYRCGVMAADSGGFQSGTVHSGHVKVARAPDGTLYGVTGKASEGSAFLSWVRAGAMGDHPIIRRTDDKAGESAYIVLRVRSGHCPEVIDAYGIEECTGRGYVALGAAFEAALGALHAGASAVEAVEAAIAHSQWACGPVVAISHSGDF